MKTTTMKPIVLSYLLMVLCASGIARADDGKHLFILSGQSNMAGLNPKTSFEPAVVQAFGQEHVIVVKDAQGGRPIRNWHNDWKSAGAAKVAERNGTLYERLMAKVKPAIEGQTLASVTFVWMQGERDAREMHGEVYAESLRGLLGQLKNDLKRDDLFFVIGRLSDFDMKDQRYAHWTKVREAQVMVAESDPRGAWVDTDEWNGKGNGLHYDKPGYLALGNAFAEKAIALIEKSK